MWGHNMFVQWLLVINNLIAANIMVPTFHEINFGNLTNLPYIILNSNLAEIIEKFNGKFDIFIFINPNNHNLDPIKISHQNFRGNLFFVIENNFKINSYKNLIKMAVETGALNIFFITNSTTIYTWNPLSKINSCGSYFIPEKLDKMDKKIPGYNSNCSIKITYIKAYPFVGGTSTPNPGLFIRLFDLIQNLSKIKIEYEFDQEFQNEFFYTGSLHKVTTHLINKRTDVVIGHVFMIPTDEIESGPMFYEDGIVIVVPKPARVKIYRRILKVFKFNVWFSYILIFFIISISHIILSNYYRENFRISRVLLNNFSLNFGGGITRLPKRFNLRLIFISYLLYIINLQSIYLGKLSGMLTVPAQGIRIADIESMYIQKAYFNMSQYVENVSRVHDRRINNPDWKENVHVLNRTEVEILTAVTHLTERSAFTFKSIVQTYPYSTPLHNYIRSFAYESTLSLTYFLRKNGLLNWTIRFWSNEIIEKGFFLKWWQDIVWGNVNYTLIREGIIEYEGVIVLNLKHYEEAFLILFYGYCLATIVFCWEFVAIRIEKKVDIMRKHSRF